MAENVAGRKEGNKLRIKGLQERNAMEARRGWTTGESDKCPSCGSDLEAYEAEVNPRNAEVEMTYSGIRQIDVRFRGRCMKCGATFSFTSRYGFIRGAFDVLVR